MINMGINEMYEEEEEEEAEEEPTPLQRWKRRAGITELHQSEYDAPLAELLNKYGDTLTDKEWAWIEVRSAIRNFADLITNIISVRHSIDPDRDATWLRLQLIEIMEIISDTPEGKERMAQVPPITPEQLALLVQRFGCIRKVVAKMNKYEAGRLIAKKMAENL